MSVARDLLASLMGGEDEGKTYAPNPRRPWERVRRSQSAPVPVVFTLRIAFVGVEAEGGQTTRYLDASGVGPAHTVWFVKEWAAGVVGVASSDVVFARAGDPTTPCDDAATMGSLGIDGSSEVRLTVARPAAPRGPPSLPATRPPRVPPPRTPPRRAPVAAAKVAPPLPLMPPPPISSLFAERGVQLFRALNVRGDGMLGFGEASALYSRAEWDDVRHQALPAGDDARENLGVADWTNWLLRLRQLYSEREVMYDLLEALRTLRGTASGSASPRSPSRTNRRRVDAQMATQQPIWYAAQRRAFADSSGWRERLSAARRREAAHVQPVITVHRTRIAPRVRRQLLVLGRARLADLVDAQLGVAAALPYERWFAFLRLLDAGGEPHLAAALGSTGLIAEFDGADQRQLFAIFDVDRDGALNAVEAQLAIHAMWYYSREAAIAVVTESSEGVEEMSEETSDDAESKNTERAAAAEGAASPPRAAARAAAERDAAFGALVEALFAAHGGAQGGVAPSDLARCALYLLSVESAVRRGEVTGVLAVRAATAAKLCAADAGTTRIGASAFAAHWTRARKLERDADIATRRVMSGGSRERKAALAATAEMTRCRAALEATLGVIDRDVELRPVREAEAEAEAEEEDRAPLLALPAPPTTMPPRGTPRRASEAGSASAPAPADPIDVDEYALVLLPPTVEKAKLPRSRGKRFMERVRADGAVLEKGWRR